MNVERYLPKGLRVASKAELLVLLDEWLQGSTAATIGDFGGYGGQAWIVLDLGTHHVRLNGDTTREAVEAFCHRQRIGPQSRLASSDECQKPHVQQGLAWSRPRGSTWMVRGR